MNLGEPRGRRWSARWAIGAVTGAGPLCVVLLACAPGGSSRATVDAVPASPPTGGDRVIADAAPETPEPEAVDSVGPDARVDLAAMAPGYPASVQVGARVSVVQTEPDEIVVQVGDSLSMGDDVRMVAVSEDGSPVGGVRILASVESRFAVLEDGFIRGIAEGEAELRMAIRAPPLAGTGPAVVRTFSVPVRVRGRPVATVDITDPGVRFLTGSVVALGAVARTDSGDVRSRVDISWSSNRRRIATVDARGFVHSHRPGNATITATADEVQGSIELVVEENPVAQVALSGPTRGRTGDVLHFAVSAVDGSGVALDRVPVDFSVSSLRTESELGASVYADGAFVAERPGLYRITATAGGVSGQALVEVSLRGADHDIAIVGRGLVADRPTSDLWAFTGIDGRDYVYTGTHSGGQRMLVWDVTNPGNPVLTDFVEVDARVVNDVKVNAAATLAVITREGASDRKNGIVLLDLADPAHPVIVDQYTKDLTGGVHNVFFAGNVLYAVHNGTFDVHVLDVTDPGDVREVGRWGIDSPGKYLHDIWVADGMAYVSYWDDGVYVLDVGDGRWGGAPARPVEVSRYAYPEGHTHVAFPYTNADGHRYLFVGDEVFGCDRCVSRNGHPGDGSRGFVHILDLENPEELREVARYEVPEAGAHNIWVEDDKMYVAYYQAGLRVVDVSGELRGNLYAQGREIAWLPTGAPDGHVPNAPMAWGPHPFKGHVFVSDLNSGLWVVRVEPKSRARPVS